MKPFRSNSNISYRQAARENGGQGPAAELKSISRENNRFTFTIIIIFLKADVVPHY